MELFRKNTLLATIIAASSLGLVACHDDDDAPVAVEPPPVVTPPSATLSGVAVKGILSNAEVIACLVASDCDNAETSALAQAATGFVGGPTSTLADGSYSLTVDEDGVGQPVSIRLFATADTQQVCDYAECGDEGGLVDVPNDLVLTTVAFASPGEPVTAPVSVLSTITAKTFKDQVAAAAGPAIVSQTQFNAAATTASSNTATALGITTTTNLLTVELPNATSTDLAASTASDEVKQLAVLNASIASAAGADAAALTATVTNLANAVADVVVAGASGGETTDPDALTTLATTVTAVSTAVTTNAQRAALETPPTVSTEAPTGFTPVVVPANTGASSGGDSTGA